MRWLLRTQTLTSINSINATKQLNDLALEAYGFRPDDDLIEKLLVLSLKLATKEQRGEPIIGL